VTCELVEWPLNSKDQGQSYLRIKLDEDPKNPKLSEYRDMCLKGRAKMIESLSDYDDEIADAVLSDETGNYATISQEVLKKVNCQSFVQDLLVYLTKFKITGHKARSIEAQCNYFTLW
jgi:hypothetical protein